MRTLSLIVFVLMALFSAGQTDEDFFDGTLEDYTLWDLREYYSKNYPDFEDRINAIKKNSDQLVEKNTDLYLLNRIYFCQFLLISNHRKEGIREIAELERISRIKQLPKLQGYLFNVKGGEQFSFNRAERGREQYKKALYYLKLAKDSVGIKANYINIANCFASESKTFDSSMYYFNLAMEIENAGFPQFSKALRLNYSRLLMNDEEYEKAISLLTTDAFYPSKIKDVYSRVIVEMNLADAYFQINENDSSILHYEKAKQLALREGLMQLPTINRGLALAYYKEHDFKAAFNLMRESDSLERSFQTEHLSSLSEEMHLKHQQELYEKEAELNKLEIEHQKSETNLLYVFIVISIGFILFLVILYSRIRKKNTTLARKNLELTQSRATPVSKQAKNSGKQTSPELIKQIEVKLYQEKIFTNPEITVEKLAKKLGTNRTYLSENVNHHFGKSFRSVINQLRIQEACKMLSSDQYNHYSIEGIAISVGYRNLSSFNSTFKRETGITPSFFRKNSAKS